MAATARLKENAYGLGGPSAQYGVRIMENRSDNVIALGQAVPGFGRTFWSFRYPHEVVRDTQLSVDEKRAILSAWASDEHAVESLPTLRRLPGTPFPVTFSSIMDARIALDKLSGMNDDDPPPPHSARARAKRVPVREAA